MLKRPLEKEASLHIPPHLYATDVLCVQLPFSLILGLYILWLWHGGAVNSTVNGPPSEGGSHKTSRIHCH